MDSSLAEVASVLADVAGTNPATGAYRYYFSDHLGSTRGLYDGSKSALGGYEYTPYGEVYASSGSVALGGLAAAFTGKPWDAAAQMYYFPYRWYSPSAARWLTRDPLGMVDGPNVYAYVRANVIDLVDLTGDFSAVAKLVLVAIAVVLLIYFGYCAIKNGKQCLDALEQFRLEVQEFEAQGEFELCEQIWDSVEREKKRREEAAAIGALPGFQKVMDECPEFITSMVGPRS